MMVAILVSPSENSSTDLQREQIGFGAGGWGKQLFQVPVFLQQEKKNVLGLIMDGYFLELSMICIFQMSAKFPPTVN